MLFSIRRDRFAAIIICGMSFLSGAGALLAAPQTRTLTGDGAWTWFNDPRSFYRDGALYTGWINREGDVQASRHSLAGNATSIVTLHDNYQRDDHNNPGLLPNPDGSFTAFYTQHSTSVPLQYRNVAVSPGGVMTMGPEGNLTHPNDVTGSTGWTYANPYRLNNEGTAGQTYLFSRGKNFNPVVRVRDDATGTWGAATKLIDNAPERPYVKYHSNNTNRIGFAFTDGHPRNVSNHIYYAYLQGGAYYDAKGNLIKSASSGALTPADMQNPGRFGTVYNPSDSIPNNGTDSWIWDVATDSTGAPVITYATFKSDTQHQYHWARWDGTQWIDRTLIDVAGTTIAMSGETHYSGGLALDPTDPNIVYLSRQDTSGNWDLEQWKTADGGQTWSTIKVAEGAGAGLENVRPYVPLDRPADTEMVLWLSGRYDFWDFRTSGALATSVGYDTDVKLWMNPIPEPASLGLLILGGLLCRRPRQA